MKKVILTTFAALSVAAVLSAQSVTLTNTFGGNNDNVGTSDFLKFDGDGDKTDAVVGDRLQLDVASEHIDSRIRLNIVNGSAVATNAYVNFRPIQPLNFIAGNTFFWKWTTPGAYLAATDDYLAHGKLADSNGAGVVYNLVSDDVGITFAASVGAQSRLDLNFGAQFALKDTLTIGVTAQDVTESTVSVGAYFALHAVENLLLNLGYTYNPADTSYYTGQQASNIKESYDGANAQPGTQHLAQLSVGYTLSDVGNGLSLYADIATGLNNKTHYYTVNTTTGTDSDFYELDDGVPFYGAVRANLKATENLDVNFWVRGNHWLGAKDTYDAVTVYPYFDYKTNVGTFRAGVRAFFNKDDGFNGFNIPFSWQYKIAAAK